MTMRSLVSVLVTSLACGAPLAAQHPSAGAAPAIGLTEWKPGSIVPGSAAMRLLGDPTKHEMFAVRFRYPDGGWIAPHWHTATVRITVLSGTFVVGMGAVVDSTKVQAYGPGSFVVLEAGMNHFEWFRGETTLHVEGVGPFRTVFVNPADDPRRQPRPRP